MKGPALIHLVLASDDDIPVGTGAINSDRDGATVKSIVVDKLTVEGMDLTIHGLDCPSLQSGGVVDKLAISHIDQGIISCAVEKQGSPSNKNAFVQNVSGDSRII